MSRSDVIGRVGARRARAPAFFVCAGVLLAGGPGLGVAMASGPAITTPLEIPGLDAAGKGDRLVRQVCSGPNCDAACTFLAPALTVNFAVSPSTSGHQLVSTSYQIGGEGCLNLGAATNFANAAGGDVVLANPLNIACGLGTKRCIKVTAVERSTTTGAESTSTAEFTLDIACERCPDDEAAVPMGGGTRHLLGLPNDQTFTTMFTIFNASASERIVLLNAGASPPFGIVSFQQVVLVGPFGFERVPVISFAPGGLAPGTTGSISVQARFADGGGLPRSATIPVTIINGCVADTDDGSGTGTPDGGVGIEDLLYYLGLYDAGVAGADVDDGSGTGTPDGGVGIEDLLYYLQRYEAGC